jgi:tetratricopeptide (TPR) repeat protein
MSKIGRNDPCPCGSGKKYKHCCLNNPKPAEPVATSRREDYDLNHLPSDAELDFQGSFDLPPEFMDDDFDLLDEDLVDDDAFAEMFSDPIVTERAFAHLQRLLEGGLLPKGPEADATLNEWMDSHTFPEIPVLSPLDAAQDLMYDAWMSEDPAEQIQLAHDALEITPDCADAYHILALTTAETPEETIDLLRQAVAAGERALGPEVLDSDTTDLLGNFRALPYLRATVALALTLIENESDEEATELLEHVLRVDPQDSQGARYVLLTQYLRQQNRRGVRTLFRHFKEDDSAMWAYARALLAFQEHGESRQAHRELTSALNRNPYLAGCLTNLSLLVYGDPQPFVADYELKAEGFTGARTQMAAWVETPGALWWITDELSARVDMLPPDLASIVRSQYHDE